MARVGDNVGVPIGLDETVQLSTLAMGEINEKFPIALKQVVENILSFDYQGKAKREINIKVVLMIEQQQGAWRLKQMQVIQEFLQNLLSEALILV